MKKIVFIFFVLPVLMHAQIKNGMWRGVLLLNLENNIELPFNFSVKSSKGKKQLIIQNAQERIVIDNILLKNDSLNFKMPVFDSEFRTRMINDSMLEGVWINHSRTENNRIKFSAAFGNVERFGFPAEKKSAPFYGGKWEVTFSPTLKDSSKAIGVFNMDDLGNKMSGTFLTETGDYRYLEGKMYKNKLYLSCFDGSHAFLFIADNNGTEIINGDFYSGSHWKENWIGKRNNAFELHNPEDLTKLVSPDVKIDFSFLNLDKIKISLSDNRFKNKPVVVQIMGSWCPNCMDETAYLASVYNEFNKKGLELISVCYERTTDFEKSKENLLRLKKRYNLKHEILITGLTGKESASQSLPFLTKIFAFPTTIVLDKEHHVKTIYTGFSGPATGLEYEKFKLHFENVMTQITK